jgi:bacterioferritin-associated ferredoxin
MYVCLCQAVTESEVHRAVREGTDTIERLREALGVNTGCGSCTEVVQRCADDARRELPALPEASMAAGFALAGAT